MGQKIVHSSNDMCIIWNDEQRNSFSYNILIFIKIEVTFLNQTTLYLCTLCIYVCNFRSMIDDIDELWLSQKGGYQM